MTVVERVAPVPLTGRRPYLMFGKVTTNLVPMETCLLELAIVVSIILIFLLQFFFREHLKSIRELFDE